MHIFEYKHARRAAGNGETLKSSDIVSPRRRPFLESAQLQLSCLDCLECPLQLKFRKTPTLHGVIITRRDFPVALQRFSSPYVGIDRTCDYGGGRGGGGT